MISGSRVQASEPKLICGWLRASEAEVQKSGISSEEIKQRLVHIFARHGFHYRELELPQDLRNPLDSGDGLSAALKEQYGRFVREEGDCQHGVLGVLRGGQVVLWTSLQREDGSEYSWEQALPLRPAGHDATVSQWQEHWSQAYLRHKAEGGGQSLVSPSGKKGWILRVVGLRDFDGYARLKRSLSDCRPAISRLVETEMSAVQVEFQIEGAGANTTAAQMAQEVRSCLGMDPQRVRVDTLGEQGVVIEILMP